MNHTVDYQTAAKNQWRNQAYNKLMMPKTDRENEIVLYLAAGADMDSFTMRRHGIKPWNMIAVEIDPLVVKKLRSEGRNVIHAPIQEVLANWPAHALVGVVMADFMCGLENYAMDALFCWAVNIAFRASRICVNFQRGREVESRAFTWKRTRKFIDCDDDKNRAFLASVDLHAKLSDWGFIGFKEDGTNDLVARRIPNVPAITEIECFDGRWSVHSGDAFVRWPLKTYKRTAKSVKMDSLVLFDLGFYQRLDRDEFEMEGLTQNKAIRQKISAALAVRTMQMQGQVRHKRVG